MITRDERRHYTTIPENMDERACISAQRDCRTHTVAYVAIQGYKASPHEILEHTTIDDGEPTRLLLVLLVATLLLLGSSGHPLALDATRAATTVWRGERKVDVLLGVQTDDEGGHVDDLLANARIPAINTTGTPRCRKQAHTECASA